MNRRSFLGGLLAAFANPTLPKIPVLSNLMRYKGIGFDAGMFYCPYVPLQMVRTVNSFDFKTTILSKPFKTR